MEWITSTELEDEDPNIDWIISILPVKKKDDGNPDHNIKSWSQTVGSLKYLLKKRLNLKGGLLLCTYHWPDELK